MRVLCAGKREGIDILHAIKHIFKRNTASVSYLNKVNPNIMVFIMYGLLYETVLNMYKPFAIKFLERIGGTKLDVSLFYSLPGLVAALALLPGVFFLTRLSAKKNITSALFLASRFFILLLAFVPFMPASVRPFMFVSLIALMNLPEALAQTSLQGFLGNVFAGDVRAKAISLRNKFGNMVVLLVTFMTGWIISYAPKNDGQRTVCYQVFFVLAFTVGLLEIFVFRKFKEDKLPENASSKNRPEKCLEAVKAAMKDKRFRSFLIPTILFQFTWQAGWPLASIYQIDTLKATEIWLAAFSMTTCLFSFLSAGAWNKRINKHGNQKALIAASFMMAANMLLIAKAPNLPLMTLVQIFSGISVIGINTTLLNGLLLATPDENRILYLGTYNAWVNISLFVSPIFANLLLSAFGVSNAMMAVFGLRVLAASFILFWRRQ